MKQQSAIVTSTVPTFEALLEKMMPHFRYFARKSLRLKGDDLDDALQELTLLAYAIYQPLVEKGKAIFFTPIMRYAIGRYREGRRFMGSNSTDVLAERTKQLGRTEVSTVHKLDFLFDQQRVAKSVQFKLDFTDWYRQQTAQDQKIMHLLAMGEKPSAVAKMFGVTPSAITYNRRKYAGSWDSFINTDKKEAGSQEETCRMLDTQDNEDLQEQDYSEKYLASVFQ